MNLKLGKHAKRHDPRTLKLAKYLTQLPPIPSAMNWSRNVPIWGMMGNDQLGDCLGAGCRILTEDLRWVPVEEVSVGDKLVGFDEVASGNHRKFKSSVVERVEVLKKKCYDLIFSDGTKIRASHDHCWLRKRRSNGSWVKTEQMQIAGGKATHVGKCLPVWDVDESYCAGYLAGVYDGEGCLQKSKSGTMKTVQFAQRPNEVLTKVEESLSEKGYRFTTSHIPYSSLSPNGYSVVRILGGRKEAMRFLGSIRPARLLAKFSADSLGKLEVQKLKLVNKIDVGIQQVYAIQTSSRTFIAEGIASHNCTIAAAGHMEMLWTSQTGTEYVPADSDIVLAYSSISGYTPGNPGTDQGANMLDVLNFWRNAGISSRRIQAYAEVDPHSNEQVSASISLFGGLYVGVQLPQSAMDQTENQQCWDGITDTNILGGHAINLVAYDQWTLSCVTWGRVQQMTWSWFQHYADEAYAVLSPDWLTATGAAPSGFNQAQLADDLNAL